MTDYSEHGAIPVEDAATDDPPTVDEVIERQRREYPEQARTSTTQAPTARAPMTEDERSTVEAGGEPVDVAVGDVGIEGPNSE